jgi:hypothetical protein
MMTEVRKQSEEIDPVRAREYFKGLLGKGFREWTHEGKLLIWT